MLRFRNKGWNYSDSLLACIILVIIRVLVIVILFIIVIVNRVTFSKNIRT